LGEGFLQVLGVLGELLDAVHNAGTVTLATAIFVQLDDGCPFSLQVKHVLSFQYSLSKVVLPWPLPSLPPLLPF
jgi:hypothetical protein